MGIKNINLTTVQKTGISKKVTEEITQKAKSIQPEVKEVLKKIDEIPSETLRANLLPKVKKAESITSKV